MIPTKPMQDEEAIFDEAVANTVGEERDQFLATACGENMELKNRVQSLLESHENTSFILNRKVDAGELLSQVDIELPNDDVERVGTQVGHYKLLQQIGEGGMGVVFMAQQLEPVRRKVAVKIIRSGMDSKQVLYRFEAERQALARMEHPNITRVLDAGVAASGRPYFVMELVRGTEITTYCDKNKVPVTERLELFKQVCSAIHHAHQKGIIHRDIKPTNIMVTMHDGVPVPKVIDFGIAKALDRPLTEQTLFTHYGELIGTPEYMSPEQAELSGLDLDVRCDVYSLGVLLFELLTGSTPLDAERVKKEGLLKLFETIRDFDAETASQRITNSGVLLDSIADSRQTTPQTLGRILKGDLDWIIAKALSKDRNRRYESAAAMGRDVGRYLSGEATEAAAPTLIYRTRKFVNKHTLACVFATVLATVMIVGTATSVYFAVKATAAQRVSALQMIDLAAEKQTSDERRIRAETALKRAELAEAEAKHLGRLRQNDAAMSRAMARFSIEQAPKFIRDHMNERLDSLVKNSASGTSLNKFGSFDVIRFGGPVKTLQELKDGPVLVASGTSEPEFVTNMPDATSIEMVSPESNCKLLEIILEEQRKELGSNDPFVAGTLFELGKARLGLKQFESAELCLRESLGILGETNISELSESELPTKEVISTIVECLNQQGKTEQAADFRERLDN